MREVIEKPKPELSPYAPRFVTIKIRPEKIREIIGPGGKVIRGIQEQTGTKIDVEDDGRVTVFSPDNASVQKALASFRTSAARSSWIGSISARSRRSSSSARSSRSSRTPRGCCTFRRSPRAGSAPSRTC